MEFSELLYSKRKEKYNTAKDFFNNNDIPCAYNHYILIERGDAIPKIDLTISLLNILKIDKRRGLYAWTRSQMPSEETRLFFSDIEDTPSKSKTFSSNENSLILNRAQVNIIGKDPIYWELILYINAGPSKKKTTQEISEEFNLTQEEIQKKLNDLFDHGIIEKDNNNKYHTTKKIFLSHNEEFNNIRDQNFLRSVEQFLQKQSKNKFKSTVTVGLNHSQAQEIEKKSLELCLWVLNQENDNKKNKKPYTFGTFFSERKFGN